MFLLLPEYLVSILPKSRYLDGLLFCALLGMVLKLQCFKLFSFPQVSPAVLFAFWQHKHYHESSEQSSDYPQNLLFRHIFFLRRSELR